MTDATTPDAAPVTTAPTPIPSTPITHHSARWMQAMTAFASTSGLDRDEVDARLQALVGKPNDAGLEMLGHPGDTPYEDLREAFSGAKVPLAPLNRAIRELRSFAAPTPTAPTTPVDSARPAAAPSVMALLPVAPDDESLLAGLKIGGVSIVPITDVSAALRAFVAHRLGVFDIPDRLQEALITTAESLNQPVDETFYELSKLITERHYGEVLSVFGGDQRRWMSEARKKALFAKMMALGPALQRFQQALAAWRQTAQDRLTGPAMMAGLLAAMSGNGLGGGVLPGMTDMPDTGGLRDAAEAVVEAFNSVFAGTGVPVVRALAYEAVRLRKVLEDPRLPAAVGAPSRDAMLRSLKIGVTSDVIRSEQDLVAFVLGIYELPKVPSHLLPQYAIALVSLGERVNWIIIGGDKDSAPKEAPFRGAQRF